jgi:hypothetical protein
MIELLIFEGLNARLFEQMERLQDGNLEGEALDEEIKRANALTKRDRPAKNPEAPAKPKKPAKK